MTKFSNSKLATYFFPIILIFFSLILAYQNYTPGTYLSGWDNLHPEFNFRVNIIRSLFAPWQEYQGLGLLGGMAHAADLPRQLILLFLSFILPNFFLRYFWHFAMLVVGPLGVYAFILSLTKNKFGSFLGSAFYLFNLSTVQYFYVPYEAFSTFYGLFPVTLLAAIRYQNKSSRRHLLEYILLSFLLTPAFYVQTFFIVYVVLLGIFFLSKPNLKLALVTFFINAFWLLPVVYFSLTNASVIGASKVNSIATPETALMNQGFGDLIDIANLRGFWLQYLDGNVDNTTYNYLMSAWRDHAFSFTITAVGLLLFCLSFLGISLHFITTKGRSRFTFISIFLLCVLMLTAGAGPLGVFYNFLANNVPLFGEMFRSPFTKWSGATAFIFAVGLGFFVHFLTKSQKVRPKLFVPVFTFSLFFAMIYQMAPAFRGHLISSTMRLELPSEYHALFAYFNNEPKESRIARFPVATFWGWDFYNWGYRGSGFLWYGIEQPILDRAFDVWSGTNESYYHEVSNAIYQNDPQLLGYVLKKYQVTYALVDESVILPATDNSILKFDQTKSLLSAFSRPVWHEGFLTVYQIDGSSDQFVKAPASYTNVSSTVDKTRLDPIYADQGTYIYSPNALTYPFANIFQEDMKNFQFQTDFNNLETLNISQASPSFTESANLLIPPLPDNQPLKIIAVLSYQNKLVQVTPKEPFEIKIDGKVIATKSFLPAMFVETDKIYDDIIVTVGDETFTLTHNGPEVVGELEINMGVPLSLNVFEADPVTIDLTDQFNSAQYNLCWEREGESGSFNVAPAANYTTITTEDAVACTAFKLGNLKNPISLLSVTEPYKSGDGARPHFCVVKEGESDCLNSEVFYHSSTSVNWTNENRKLVLPGNTNYWLILAARPPEESNQSWTIDYQAPIVQYYPNIGGFTFSDTNWARLKEERWINIPPNATSISVSFPVKSQEFDFATEGVPVAKNCDFWQRGSVGKTMINSVLTYEARRRGASCDYLLLDNITTNKDHLVRFIGHNLSGRSMKFYLYNDTTKRSDLEILLPKGKFDSSYTTLSWPFLEDREYLLNLETRSFGTETSQNELEKVFVYTPPLSWLASWQIIPKDYTPQVSNLKIISSQKTGTAIYKVTLEGDHGLLVLSQSYDSGWLAFKGNGDLLPHTKVNSWANGWLIDEPVNTVYIFYWPLLLEWLGLLLLPLTFLLLLL